MQSHDAELLDAAPLSPSLRNLARRGVLRRHRTGTLLIREGEQGDTLFIVLAGSLRAFAQAENGREITYGIYGPGEYVGELSLDGGRRSAHVEALEPSVCAVVRRKALLEHIGAEPAFALELLAKVIRRARTATLSTRQLALEDAYGRLRRLLDSMATPFTDGERLIEPRPTHRAISQAIGCSREMVSKLTKDLERGGYLRTEGHAWVLVASLPQRW